MTFRKIRKFVWGLFQYGIAIAAFAFGTYNVSKLVKGFARVESNKQQEKRHLYYSLAMGPGMYIVAVAFSTGFIYMKMFGKDADIYRKEGDTWGKVYNIAMVYAVTYVFLGLIAYGGATIWPKWFEFKYGYKTISSDGQTVYSGAKYDTAKEAQAAGDEDSVVYSGIDISDSLNITRVFVLGIFCVILGLNLGSKSSLVSTAFTNFSPPVDE